MIAHRRRLPQRTDVSDAVKSFNLAPCLHLSNAADLNPGNSSRTFLEVERE